MTRHGTSSRGTSSEGTPSEGTSSEDTSSEGRASQPDELYVGWEEKAPPAFARRARLSAIVLLLLAPALGLFLAMHQSSFDEATFEYGEIRQFEGVLRLLPHPILEVATPEGGIDHWLLVAVGKHGAGEETKGFEGQRVRLRGTLVYRGQEAGETLRTMVEVAPGSLEALRETTDQETTDQETTDQETTAIPVSLGRHTLRGEIVDSKCWLGVMKPGHGKAHRACASLCIRGGIPPLLAVGEGEEVVRQLLLLGPDGEAVNEKILHAVAEPVEITGEVFLTGELWSLHADLSTLRRLGGES